MKKALWSILSLVLAFTIMIPVYATSFGTPETAPDQSEFLQGVVIQDSKPGSMTIDYREDEDSPVTGAVFTYYKIADIGNTGGYLSIIPEIETIDAKTKAEDILETVLNKYADRDFVKGFTYEAKTDDKGMAVTEDMEQGLYLAVETTPAEKHFASIPFLFSVPFMRNGQWTYDAFAEPKSLPANDLIIEKTVEGKDGDKKKEWSFKVDLDSKDEFEYERSDGDKGTVKNGDTLKLSHGQSITISMLPVGTSYSVKEVEANKDGYKTTTKGVEGVIELDQASKAEFTNAYVEKPNKENPSNPRSSRNVKTGDTNQLFYIAGIFFLSLLAFVALGKRQFSEK